MPHAKRSTERSIKRLVKEEWLHEEALFKEVELEECPICLIPLPHSDQTTFESCCGKRICNGCVYIMKMSEGGADLCPFCRTPYATSTEEEIKRTKKLVDKGNAEAFNMLGGCYAQGIMGIPQDHRKANELMLKAGELGCAEAYLHLGLAYNNGRGGFGK